MSRISPTIGSSGMFGVTGCTLPSLPPTHFYVHSDTLHYSMSGKMISYAKLYNLFYSERERESTNIICQTVLSLPLAVTIPEAVQTIS